MEDTIKIRVAKDEELFCRDVDSLVDLLVSRKGTTADQLYFQQTFPQYMRQLQREAQKLVEKYSSYLTRDELIPLKSSLQLKIEKGLERLYLAITR